MIASNPSPPQLIYVVRHGEKPADPAATSHGQPTSAPAAPFGVDVDGNQNAHSLLPRGWQRSGALAVLFDPAVGAPQAGLRTPTALYSPSYGKPDKTAVHRTHQTIQGLAGRLGLPIQSPVPEGQESALADTIVASGGAVVLICWEHDHIPALAQAIPTVDATMIPTVWPGDRFDVIWVFSLDPATGRYTFGQVPQQLLEGDTDTVIAAGAAGGGVRTPTVEAASHARHHRHRGQ
jgi:hypothetical protein